MRITNFFCYNRIVLLAVFFAVVTISFTYLVFKHTRDKDFLNFIGKFYFDQQYYLEQYPEVKDLKITPFKHYSDIGWLEGKNPNSDFDNNFYRRMYLTFHSNSPELNPLQHSIRCKLRLQICYTNPKQLKKAVPLENPKYYLSLTAIFRDEAPFLKEWIEFYKLMGVEHFYLYNHLSKDNYLEVLDPYIKDGTVELTNFTHEPVDTGDFYELTYKAYRDAAIKSKNDAEWLIIVDSDEFLYPVQAQNLVEVLKKYDDYASVMADWRFFGSGDVKKIPEDKLMIESLTMSENAKTTWGKSIVKPRYVETFFSAHFPKLKKGYAQITENYEYFYGPFTPYQSINILAVNHYTYRDWDYFYATKISRVYTSGSTLNELEKEIKVKEMIEFNKERSSMYDDKILRFVATLRKRIFGNEKY